MKRNQKLKVIILLLLLAFAAKAGQAQLKNVSNDWWINFDSSPVRIDKSYKGDL